MTQRKIGIRGGQGSGGSGRSSSITNPIIRSNFFIDDAVSENILLTESNVELVTEGTSSVEIVVND